MIKDHKILFLPSFERYSSIKNNSKGKNGQNILSRDDAFIAFQHLNCFNRFVCTVVHVLQLPVTRTFGDLSLKCL